MAIGTFVVLQVKFMAEGCLATIRLELDYARFEAFMAFAAVTTCRESIFPVVARAA